jgi:hypothetical protein
MILQYITKTRPTVDVLFFEDSEEGKTRSDAIIQLAADHPELVNLRVTDPIPATGLTWSATWTFVGWPEFREFMQLAYDADTTLRTDRSKYIMKNGQEMLIETQEEGVAERNVQLHITPSQVVRYDGSILSAADISSL